MALIYLDFPHKVLHQNSKGSNEKTNIEYSIPIVYLNILTSTHDLSPFLAAQCNAVLSS